ncbi:unnamed protein product [Cuscuta campestris]|uniref:Uncharacterized protein n=1 Tax=Cuscuta campestris TaxID=132261 RepID=A0A484LS65_9ASTE|nr:unnamed protein product [Cuscuta campestris]
MAAVKPRTADPSLVEGSPSGSGRNWSTVGRRSWYRRPQGQRRPRPPSNLELLPNSKLLPLNPIGRCVRTVYAGGSLPAKARGESVADLR